MRPLGLAHSFRQLGNIGGYAPCLVAGQQLGRRAAIDIGECPPIGVADMKHRRSGLGSASSTDQGGGGEEARGPDTLKHLTRHAKLCSAASSFCPDAAIGRGTRIRVLETTCARPLTVPVRPAGLTGRYAPGPSIVMRQMAMCK